MYHAKGDFGTARTMIDKAKDIVKEAGLERKYVTMNFYYGHLLSDMGFLNEALQIITESQSFLNRQNLSTDIINHKYLAEIYVETGQFEKARASIRNFLSVIKKTEAKYYLTQCFETLSFLSHKEDKPERSERLMNYALALRIKYGYQRCTCERNLYDSIQSEFSKNSDDEVKQFQKSMNLKKWIKYAEEDLN